MIVAACVEDRGGMRFNGRRVSRDRAQLSDLLDFCGGTLRAAPCSGDLFAGQPGVLLSEGFLDRAGPGEVCFLEDRPVDAFADRVEAVVLYRWNRAYPSDVRFDLDLSAFLLKERREFPGTSHETITREYYIRRENDGSKEKA